MEPIKAIENFNLIKEHFAAQFPDFDFCACGSLAVVVKGGTRFCEVHSRRWTEERIGIIKEEVAA